MERPPVIPLSTIQDKPGNATLVGQKAAGLARLLATGFPVPDGLCLTTAAFDQAHEALRRLISDYLRARSEHFDQPAALQEAATTIGSWLDEVRVPADNLASLQEQMDKQEAEQERWVEAGGLLAVRSSATAEDLPKTSFAGLYETVLGVRGRPALEAAILACWRSFYHAPALRERAALGLSEQHEGMAVLIQPLVHADCAGVCLTIDPVNPQTGQMVINATWGLGPGVVDGAAASDTLWLNRRTLEIGRQHIVEKPSQHIVDQAAKMNQLPVPEAQQTAACLPPAWARRLAELCLAVEQLFEGPQDIEWAISGDQIWLLQSRPLTTLPPEIVAANRFPVTWSPESDRHYRWELDVYSQGEAPLRPLESDFVFLRESHREETCRIMGVERNQVTQSFNGRLYNRPTPLNLSEGDKQVRQSALTDLRERLQEQGWTAWDYWGPEIEQAVQRLRAFDLAAADGPALADHLEQAMAALRRHLSIHPRLWFKPGTAYFEAYAAVAGTADEAAAYQLLDGTENMLTNLIEGLYQLASLAGRERSVADLILSQSPDRMDRLVRLPAAADFRQALAGFLAIHGERVGDGYGSELTILEPTWQEEPQKVLDLVAAYLQSGAEDPAKVRVRIRQQRDQQVAQMCATCPNQAAVARFQRQLAYARRALATLEDHNHWIEQVSAGRVRLAVMAAARYLQKQNILSESQQIFWLIFAEITAALRGKSASNLAAVISERQAQHDRWSRFAPPPVMGLPAASLPPRPPWRNELTAASDPEHLIGLGASLGRAQGRARVVPAGIGTLPVDPGDILVAENAGPLWTPFFPLLGGLVLETGSLGQHAAVTAREYGIPAVINCAQAADLIPDRAIIVIDGKEGTVKILSAPTGDIVEA